MYAVLRAIGTEEQAAALREALAAAAPRRKLDVLRGRMVVFELASSDDETPWGTAADLLASIESLVRDSVADGCRWIADVDMELNPIEPGPAAQTHVDTVRVPAETLAVLGRLGIELGITAYRES